MPFCSSTNPGSLIICEGISLKTLTTAPALKFPHYMWGYIGRVRGCSVWQTVPSLYVRVYRRGTGFLWKTHSSLIICEGISDEKRHTFTGTPFPHYMWGYIEICKRHGLEIEVPSLYVRVYHLNAYNAGQIICSLIICEGISEIAVPVRIFRLFPHYMWGYIVNCKRLLWVFLVPSLYVKVYPPGRANGKAELCSLIIYEGISKLAMASFRHQKI